MWKILTIFFWLKALSSSYSVFSQSLSNQRTLLLEPHSPSLRHLQRMGVNSNTALHIFCPYIIMHLYTWYILMACTLHCYLVDITVLVQQLLTAQKFVVSNTRVRHPLQAPCSEENHPWHFAVFHVLRCPLKSFQVVQDCRGQVPADFSCQPQVIGAWLYENPLFWQPESLAWSFRFFGLCI